MTPTPPEVVPAQVGDRLFAVPTDGRYRAATEWVIVSKIGRKWLTLSRESGYEWGRCDRETLAVDAGNYSARHTLYRTEEEYREECRRGSAWADLRRIVSGTYGIPEHVTTDAIEQMVRQLSAPPPPPVDVGEGG